MNRVIPSNFWSCGYELHSSSITGRGSINPSLTGLKSSKSTKRKRQCEMGEVLPGGTAVAVLSIGACCSSLVAEKTGSGCGAGRCDNAACCIRISFTKSVDPGRAASCTFRDWFSLSRSVILCMKASILKSVFFICWLRAAIPLSEATADFSWVICHLVCCASNSLSSVARVTTSCRNLSRLSCWALNKVKSNFSCAPNSWAEPSLRWCS